jgi:hypothetical protein
MFQFAWFAQFILFIQMTVFGFPHSDTFGSLPASGSPKRFVGCYVLPRLCVPRYPPLALSSLSFSLFLQKLLTLLFSLFFCSFQGAFSLDSFKPSRRSLFFLP